MTFLKLSFAVWFQHIYLFLLQALFTALNRDFNWMQQAWVYFLSTGKDEGVKNNILVIIFPHFLTIINYLYSHIFCLGISQKGGAGLRMTKYVLKTLCCSGVF